MSFVSILVIGPSRCVCDEMNRLSGREHLVTSHEVDGYAGVTRAVQERFDVVLIDDPQGDLDTLRTLRVHSEIPVMVLTEKQDPVVRVRGFQLGADDCLVRPFETEELAARLQALVRRAASPWRENKADTMICGHLRLSMATRKAYLRDRDLGLTGMESTILEHLMRSQGTAVSRDVLAIGLYGRECSPFERTVDTHISRIRKKLGDHKDMIISVRGSGYQLSVPLIDTPRAS